MIPNYLSLVIAVQHHILAEMYLVLFNPSIPRVGGTRKAAEKRLTEQIQALLRSLCGIGICNQWSPPAMFTACMGIAIGMSFVPRPCFSPVSAACASTSRLFRGN